jgi:hypothetical protein
MLSSRGLRGWWWNHACQLSPPFVRLTKLTIRRQKLWALVACAYKPSSNLRRDVVERCDCLSPSDYTFLRRFVTSLPFTIQNEWSWAFSAACTWCLRMIKISSILVFHHWHKASLGTMCSCRGKVTIYILAACGAALLLSHVIDINALNYTANRPTYPSTWN